MAETTWLQAQIPRNEWNKLNERRLKLKFKWADILLPATLEYLDKLEVLGKTNSKKGGEK